MFHLVSQGGLGQYNTSRHLDIFYDYSKGYWQGSLSHPNYVIYAFFLFLRTSSKSEKNLLCINLDFLILQLFHWQIVLRINFLVLFYRPIGYTKISRKLWAKISSTRLRYQPKNLHKIFWSIFYEKLTPTSLLTNDFLWSLIKKYRNRGQHNLWELGNLVFYGLSGWSSTKELIRVGIPESRIIQMNSKYKFLRIESER